MTERISGSRGANATTQYETVHVLVDSERADKGEVTKALAGLGSKVLRRLLVQRGNDRVHALAREAAVARAARVIAVGDDAFVNQVVGGLMSVESDRRPALGIVPCGSSTEIARGAGIAASLERALIDALIGAPHLVDVGRWGGRWFLDLVRGGALCEAPLARTGLGSLMGGLAYAVAGVMGLPAMRPVEMWLRGESFAWSGSAYALAIGNTRNIGAGFGLCPDASVADGELDVTIIPASLDLSDVLEIIDERGVAGVHAVRRFRSPWVELRAGSRVHLDIDGELRSCAQARFDLARGGLGLVLPAHSPLLDSPRALAKPRAATRAWSPRAES